MKSSKGKGTIRLALLLVLIAVAGFFGYSYMDDIKLGLDLAGGVSITYQAKEENPSAEDMSDTIYKLQQRVEGYSTEAEVYQEGDNRINIDIPGESDANEILTELGKPGSLVFMDSQGNTILTGDQVASAQGGMVDGNTGKEYVVSLTFTEEGTKAFADATTNNVGNPIYIVYDNEIVSAPVVREAITGGQCTIDGMSDFEEAENLAATIRIGSLSLELEELRSNVVGAKLGQQAITTSLKAGAVGFAIVAVFMIAVYLIPGLAAVLALSLYVGLILILLVSFEVTLTLPGVAGIILSIGMAVDANVIIFTRIKEEIGAGKAVKTAIDNGFQKALSAIVDGNVTTLIAAAVLFWRGSGTVKGFASTLAIGIVLSMFTALFALSAIVDGNVTTLIAAAVLFWRGSGTVKGFASTLAIGIVLSMFTALFVTRFALNALYSLGIENPKFYGIKKETAPKPFLKYRKFCFVLSAAAVAAGFVFMGMNRSSTGQILNYSMEFKGGTSTNVTFNEEMSQERIESEVVPLVEEITKDADVQTQRVTGTNEVIIKTRTLNVEERQAFEKAMQENFGVEEGKIAAESISGAVSQEMKRDAMAAVIIATIGMLLYIWLRFKNIRFAGSSVLALVHDVLVVLACYAAFKWSVGSTFIACMLTIVGYSINATIVIFDRIRENMKERRRDQSLEEVVNLSITQTFTRSINTSLTTFIMVLALYIMGVSSIREFALPLMVGIVCGTYSSVCLTGAMWYEMSHRKEKNGI